ncbi:lipoprotein [Nocardioides luteus]|uniref:Lipoprotein n=1 Tax=Nocardioides luteus TaxID=1844 RepID=A0ABQ5SVV8_9ACTN|nr:lipoprotein [Nocardioides luteus]GLJ68287.1 lipoprotein [Nocardioides luteus]
MIVSIFALSSCGSGGSSDSAGTPQVESLADSSAGKAAPPEKADAAAPRQAVVKASIISTGSVSLSAKDVGKTRTQVQRVSDKYAGQVTEQETSEGDGDGPSHARMVLRIPSKSFTDAMSDLEDAATLLDSNTTSTDVTTEVVDTEVRVKNARSSIERIRTLLSRAEAIGDVISIESELARREADLNSLLAQQAALEDQTSLSTITVDIDRAGPGGAGDEDPGFLAGLSAGWEALGGSARVLAVALGAVVPWVPVVALVLAPVWLLAKRRKQGVAPVPATGPADE